MNKQSINSANKKIKPRLMSHSQIYKYLGGCVGRDKLYQMMKDGTIKSAWLGGKLVAEAGSVDAFVDSLFEKTWEDNQKGLPLYSKQASVVLTNHTANLINL